jgi:hypothetical protein
VPASLNVLLPRAECRPERCAVIHHEVLHDLPLKIDALYIVPRHMRL